MATSRVWWSVSRGLGGAVLGLACLPLFVATGLDHEVGLFPWAGFWFTFIALGAGWIGRGRMARWVPLACMACAAWCLGQVLLQQPRPHGIVVLSLPVALALVLWIGYQRSAPPGPVSLALAEADRQWLRALFRRARVGPLDGSSPVLPAGAFPLLAGLLGVLVGSVVVMTVQSHTRFAVVADLPAAPPAGPPAATPVAAGRGAVEKLLDAAQLSVRVEASCRPGRSSGVLTLVCRFRNGPTAAVLTVDDLLLAPAVPNTDATPLGVTNPGSASSPPVVELQAYGTGDVLLRSAPLARTVRAELARGRAFVVLRYSAHAAPAASEALRAASPGSDAPAGFEAPVESRVVVAIGRGIVQ